MTSRTDRAASPKPKASPKATSAPAPGGAEKIKWEAPPRPEGLGSTVVRLYGGVATALLFFVLVGETLKHPVPEGKFEKKDGSLIDIADFDPVESGPYPKCHPQNKHYSLGKNESGIEVWALIDSAPKDGPFPPGHPENEAWKEKWDARVKKENAENRFTWKGLQPSLHMWSLAVLSVFIGSLHATWIFTSKEGSGEGDAGDAQVLQKEDAYWFPVIGSCALFSLFIVYKYLGSELIKYLISCYVVTMCAGAFGTNVGQFITLLRGKAQKPLFVVPFFELEVSAFDLVGYIIGGCMAGGYLMTKNWIINNVMGVSFCFLGMKKIGTSDFKTGAIMLVGLFFYDIFWVFGSTAVFGSNVMVTVAKGVEAPIKLMFPRSQDGCGNLEFSMLGLGDIVVPGIYITFLAKWDAVVQGKGKSNSFVYLNTTMVSYILSLVVTVGVMLFFNAAQPALLYIVPFTMLTSAAVALVRGEFKDLLEYTIPEGDEDKPAETPSDDTKKDK